MNTKSYDAAELARWDPWNDADAPKPPEPQGNPAHAGAKSRLARCRIALANARLALDHSQEEGERSEEEQARRLEPRAQLLGAERTVADLERLLFYPPAGA